VPGARTAAVAGSKALGGSPWANALDLPAAATRNSNAIRLQMTHCIMMSSLGKNLTVKPGKLA
jgi:hypothetical protein